MSPKIGVVLVALLLPASARAAELTALDSRAVVASGPVSELTRAGGTIYARGGFTTIGRYVGSTVALAPSGARFPGFPRIDGQISDAVDDGVGGVFLGGDLTRADGVPHRGVVRLKADGTVDERFTANVSGQVYALARDGSTLYVGGLLQDRRGTYTNVIALDAATGQRRSVRFGVASQVRELAVAAAPGRPARLLVGTSASRSEDGAPSTLFAVDPVTGRRDPGFTAPIQTDVRALATDGATVWAGGTDVLLALDAATGAPRPGFSATPNGTVHVLLRDGGRLLAGGGFDALGGGTGALVALDPASGKADPAFSPGLRATGQRLFSEPEESAKSADRGVFEVLRVGGRLWAGGRIAPAQGPATGLVALDAGSGAPAPVTAPPFDGQVNALTALGGRLVVGGQFVTPGARVRRGFAALDARTLEPRPEFRPPRTPAKPMTIGGGRIFLAEDHFRDYRKGVRRFFRTVETIRSLDARTGAPAGRLRVVRPTGIAVLGNELFVARRLNDYRRWPDVRIDVRDTRSLRLKRSFRIPLPGYVSRLAAFDGRLYAAGSFRRKRPGGQQANIALVRLDPRSGRVDAGFDPHVTGPVNEVAATGGTLFVAGTFTRVGGRLRTNGSGIAGVAAGDGALRGAFRPFGDRGYDTRLTGLPDLVLDLRYGSSTLLEPASGRRLRGPRAGFAPESLDAAVAGPAGLVAAGQLEGNERGLTSFGVDVVQVAG